MTQYQRSIALQIVLFFMLCRLDGLSRVDAILAFLKTPLARFCIPDLTVGMAYAFAEAAGYEDS